MRLEELNSLDLDAFTASLGHVFEHSPWVAAKTWRKRPFASAAALYEALIAAVESASADRQMALIRAHPDLAGKAALAKELTDESAREQASAGLDRLTPAEYDRFHRLNAAYRDKFSIPFIICVRQHTKDSILAAFETRLLNDGEAERHRALAEIGEIVRLRLSDLISA